MMGIREAQDSADAVALGLLDAGEAAPAWATVSIFAVGSRDVVARGPSRSRRAAAGVRTLCFCSQGSAMVPTAANTPAAHRTTTAYTAAFTHQGEKRRR